MVGLGVNSLAFKESVMSPPVRRKTTGEIYKEQTHVQAQDALKKSSQERTAGDYVAIGMDTVNKIVDNVPVVHANGTSKLNYMA